MMVVPKFSDLNLWLVYMDVFFGAFLLFAMVNHHQNTIWENIYYCFQASNKQIQVYIGSYMNPRFEGF